MKIKNVYTWITLIPLLLGFLSCSPVKFKAKSSEDPGGGSGPGPGPCVEPSCVDPGKGPFVWKTTKGECNKTCGGGFYRLVVTCVNQDNILVPEENCKEIKPSDLSKEACNTQICPTDGLPHWVTGSFGNCVPACGPGTKTRTVECRDLNGVKQDSACTEAKPPTTESCTNGPCSCTPQNKTFSQTVSGTNNKVDILLVVDDSSSMSVDNQKLASKLLAFGTELLNSNLDWQMCITTTDVFYYEGRPIKWSGTTSRVINKNTPNIGTVFQQTITDIGSGYSNDEQGIKASVLSLLNNPVYPCYRSGAAYASIILSDEDELSVGGNSALNPQQYLPLGVQNQPATFINTAKAVLGMDVRMVVNSIVAKDNSCKQVQDTQGSPAYIGLKYMELSTLTQGHIGSICDSDYSANLKYFKDAIVSTVSSVKLECSPIGTPTVTIPSGYSYQIKGNEVSFSPALPAGTTIQINYQCCP